MAAETAMTFAEGMATHNQQKPAAVLLGGFGVRLG